MTKRDPKYCFLKPTIKYKRKLLDEISDYEQKFKQMEIITVKLKKREYTPNIRKIWGAKAKTNAFKRRDNLYPNCPIWGVEIHKNGRMFYNYHVMSYDQLSKCLQCEKYPNYNECFEGPSKLVMDIDIDKENSPGNELPLINKIIKYIKKQLHKDFSFKVMRKDVCKLNASRPNKISFHIVFPTIYFQNITQVGIYLARIFVKSIEKKVDFVSILPFVDFNIYKERHLLRTYYSVKKQDLCSKFIVYKTKKGFDLDILKKSLVNHIEGDTIKCIKVENINSLTYSYHYNVFQNDLTKKDRIVRRRNLTPTQTLKNQSFDKQNKAIVDFFNICNKQFEHQDTKFKGKYCRLDSAYFSDFGTRPFRAPGSDEEIVSGQSLCLKVTSTYCLKHKRNHGNAKTKTYTYFPFSDIINSERNRWKRKVRIVNPKPSRIFKLLYKCDFRDPANSCCCVFVDEFDKEAFIEVHKRILKLINI